MKNEDGVLGIDIGGSHITLGMVDVRLKTYADDTTVRLKVDSNAPADDILAGWVTGIKMAWKAAEVITSRIGIAMPGPFDYTNGISLITGFHKYEAIYKMNIRELLAERLGISGSDIRFRNDAEAFLEGEVVGGAARGFGHAIGITLGTGIGSARSHNGVTEDAELSVTPYLDSIAEDYTSIRFFLRRYRELTGKDIRDVKSIAESVVTDPVSAQVFKEFAVHLGKFIAAFVKTDAPEVLVLGGNIANALPVFEADLRVAAGDALANVVLKKAALGETAALIGGACCWPVL